jgi:hypothetical protein
MFHGVLGIPTYGKECGMAKKKATKKKATKKKATSKEEETPVEAPKEELDSYDDLPLDADVEPDYDAEEVDETGDDDDE